MIHFSDILPPSKERKTKHKKPYRKPDSVKQLEKDYTRFYYSTKSIPENLQAQFKFRDDTANGLTKCITSHLTMCGYFAARINSTGIFDLRIGKYRKSGSTNGVADINAVVKGMSLSIEIKAGKDKPRPEQLKVQQQVESAGGMYWFINSFDEYINQLNTLTQDESKTKVFKQ